MNIREFKYGDLICRTKHSYYPGGAITRGFIDYPMKFIRAGDDGIYLEWVGQDFSKKYVQADMSVYEDDWTYWIGPRVPMPEFKGGKGPNKVERRIVGAIMAITSLVLIIAMI